MLKPSETMTFVYDFEDQQGYVPNLFGSDHSILKERFKFLDYLESENIPFAEKQVIDYNPELDEHVYYPICLDYFNKDFDYISNISAEALSLCKERRLVIVFYYEGNDDPAETIRPNIMSQIIDNEITVLEVRFVIANKAAEALPPCIYFPAAELDVRNEFLNTDDYCTEIKPDKRGKKFTCMSRTDYPFRKLFASSLWYHSLTKHGNFAYAGEPDINPNGNAESIIDTRKWADQWSDAGKLMDMFDLHTPFDNPIFNNDEIFQNAYWNFVLEDSFNPRTLGLTNNTFAPILNLQPFIIVGSPGSLELLQDLGYKTFGNYINEEYDTIDNDEERLLLVFRLAYQLSILSDEDHIKMMENLEPILKHNQQHFLASKKHRCLDLLRRIY